MWLDGNLVLRLQFTFVAPFSCMVTSMTLKGATTTLVFPPCSYAIVEGQQITIEQKIELMLT